MQNKNTAAKTCLFTVGLLYGIFGVMFISAPEKFAPSLGYTNIDLSAQIEIIAVYGGLEIAIALAVFWGLFKNNAKSAAYLCLISLLGFAGGRLIGISLHGLEGNHLSFLVLEIVLALMSFYSYRKLQT
ncbi:DUF4345 family protein [Lentisphaera marina]|uniref:DUF4345 family protein n=1 Tax=Lentisphaera marina TaxID=1111041 RepID=UPI002366E3A5|nr:DUF4345 family protein [Lentisphaera marina]MDD7987373.1 DUF4345 family protein [Lentisphaera marina]